MKILGFNLEETSYGLSLDNGGACLIVDGEVKMLINEERLYRKQYQAGFAQSIKYILSNSDLALKDIDLFVASSCLDVPASAEEVQRQLKKHGFDVTAEKIEVCDHHLSHAYSAYYPSPFEKAIILVIDGDGNVLDEKMAEETKSEKKYWHNQNEHNSYYLGDGKNISLLERDDIGADENGFGGVYRYFTYFCGFHGYKYAGKLMGLSAYGASRDTYKDVHIFELLPNGGVKCLVPDTDRLHSSSVVEKWLAENGVMVKAREPNEDITEDIEDIAWLVQRELDRALLHKVKYLVEKTGIKNICIAGGVGLNAVSNRFLLDHAGIDNIYIQPAAGDSGQCLGNAYYGLGEFDKEHAVRRQISVYQGKGYSDDEILRALEREEAVKYRKMDFEELVKIAAEKIAEGKIVAWYQGRSEIGPRALGNRSILADPRKAEMKDILNHRVKHRESFRPFAPSVLEEEAGSWFDISVSAPYMIMNAPVKQSDKIPAVTHKDGSARIQTVSKDDNPRYHALITEFFRLTGVPIVINTSLNDNESVPETPTDALNTFLRTGIDVLFMGNFFVEKPEHLMSREKRLEAIDNEWTMIASQTDIIQKAKSKVLDGKFLSLVKEYVPQSGSAFDYYCEWGEYANLLAKNGYKVTGTNESDSMIENARKRFSEPTFLTKEEFYKQLPLFENKFDLVYSNLWLCILKKPEHDTFLNNIKHLLNENGTVIVSFCHPAFDYMRESIVSHRVAPIDARYDEEFKYRKVIHENGLALEDYHRPLGYYVSLFKEHGFRILDVAESDVLSTRFYPDFIFFVLRK